MERDAKPRKLTLLQATVAGILTFCLAAAAQPAADAGQRNETHEALRQQRVRLLDRHRMAAASDDDAEAAALQHQIEALDQRILAAESRLDALTEESAGALRPLAGGLESGLLLDLRFSPTPRSQIADLSSHDNRVTSSGSAHWTREGMDDGAWTLSAPDGAVVASTKGHDKAPHQMTLSLWIRAPEHAGDLGQLLASGWRDGTPVWRLYVSPNRHLGMTLASHNSSAPDIQLPAEPALHAVPPNIWTHVAVTVDPAAVVIYINGRKDKTASVRRGTSPTIHELVLGTPPRQPQRPGFTGTIDNVHLWDRALSEVEVVGHWAWQGRLNAASGAPSAEANPVR